MVHSPDYSVAHNTLHYKIAAAATALLSADSPQRARLSARCAYSLAGVPAAGVPAGGFSVLYMWISPYPPIASRTEGPDGASPLISCQLIGAAYSTSPSTAWKLPAFSNLPLIWPTCTIHHS